MDERGFRTWTGAAIVAAAALRLQDLDRESLWLDELFTLRAATRESWAGLVDELQRDVHPPLYFGFMRIWTTLFGQGEVAARLPSALAGVAAVGVLALLGRRLAGPAAGIASASLLAVSPFAAAIDREARANSWLTLEALLATLLLAGARAGAPLRAIAAYAAIVGLMVHTHLFGLFVVAAHAIWLAILAFMSEGEGASDSPAPSRSGLVPWVVALAIGTATVVLWAPMLSEQARRFAADPWYRQPSADSVGWIWTSLSGDYGGLAGALAIGVGLLVLRGIEGPMALLVAFVAGLVLLPQVVSYLGAPVLRPRSAEPLLAVICLAAGAGYSGAGGARTGALATAMVVLWSSLAAARTVFGEPRLEQWREAATEVATNWQEGDWLYANHPHLWRFYLPAGIVPRPAEERLPVEGGRIWALAGHDDRTDAMDAIERAGTVTADRRFLGTRVMLGFVPGNVVDLAAVTLPFPEMHQLAAGGVPEVHFYWGSSFRTGPVDASGRCGIAIQARGDAAGGEPAKLALRFVAGPFLWAESVVELPVENEVRATPWFPMPARGGPPEIEVAFVNDAQADDGDRNAYLTSLSWRCEP